MKENPELYVDCSCGREVLRVAYLGGLEYEVALFRAGRYPLSWKERWRWIWLLLTKGTVWGDDMIVTAPSMKKLREFLNETLM